MSKFSLDFYLDGYETEDEMIEACKIFIYQQLNFTASGVSNIQHHPDGLPTEFIPERTDE